MARHRREGRAQALKIQVQYTGRLGGVDNKRHLEFSAHFRYLINGQNIAEHVGNMGTYHKLRPGDLFSKLLQGIFPVEKLSSRNNDLCAQLRKGSCHRVMLKPGDQDPCAPAGFGAHGDIQAMGLLLYKLHLY